MADEVNQIHQHEPIEGAQTASTQPPNESLGAWLLENATAGDTKPKSMPALPAPERLLSDFNPQCPKPSQREDGSFINHVTNFERQQKGFADANEIEKALHFQAPATGAQAGEAVLSKVKSMSQTELFAASEAYACNLSADNKPFFSLKQNWTIADEIANKLPASEANRVNNVFANKLSSRVALSHLVDGAQLLKPGSGLKAGQLSEITLADGRHYDVYVPKDADSSGRVTLYTKNASAGMDRASPALSLQEADIANQAEQIGAVAVFAYQAGDNKYLGNVMANFAGKVKSESRITAFLADNTVTFADISDLIALEDK